MRTRATAVSALLVFGALSLVACSGEPSPETLGCTTKFDCASGESCEDGICTPVSTSPVIREDGGFNYPRPDGGTRPDVGTVQTDSGQEDSGSAFPDAGEAPDSGAGLPDTGTFDAGCPTPISVDGFPGYCTIGAAVGAANNGSVIDVPAGTYLELVDITKPLTLRGTGAPVIQGTGAGSPLRLRSNGVTVDGFSIAAAGKIGIEVSGGATLNALNISGAAGIGISIAGATDKVTISNSVINTVVAADPIFGHGIDLGPGTNVDVLNTQILEAAFIGILNYQGTLVADGVLVRNPGRAACANDLDLCGYGIIADGGGATIRNNTRVENAGGVGILVYYGSMSMTGSTVINTGMRNDIWSPGILVDNSSPVNITNSTINDNQDEGVGCYINSDASCSNNVHTNNGSWTNCGDCDA